MKKLTAVEFWTLVGIQTVAATLNAQLEVLVRTVADITGEELDDGYGHASDFIYSPDMPRAEDAVRAMLRKLPVEHDEEFPKAASDG